MSVSEQEFDRIVLIPVNGNADITHLLEVLAETKYYQKLEIYWKEQVKIE